MSLLSWLSRSCHAPAPAKRARRIRARFRPALELLENRLAPSITPAHLYPLEFGTLADAYGGPALVANGGTFANGAYQFAPNQGLVLSGALANTSEYSVAISGSLDSLSQFFIKLIDFQSQSQEPGVFVEDDRLALFPGNPGGDTFTANQQFQVVLTCDGANGDTSIYLNGVLQQTYTGSVAADAIPANNVLTFFEDDFIDRGVEAVSGSAYYIATYDQVLTTDQVANLGNPVDSILPTVFANQGAVSAPENQAATDAGTWTNAVSLTASSGTVTQNAGGTWSWSGTGSYGNPYSVTITATNAYGSTATTSFNVSFTDVPPTVTANQSFVSAPENAAASNTGTWSDYDDAVTLSASTGTVTENANGTWSWTGTGDYLNPYVVTITATNANGSTASASFDVSFTDVAPTVTANQGAVSAPENLAATNSGAWSDFGEAVTLSASAGTVTENANGAWSWTGAGHYLNPYVVAIAAINANGLTASTSFSVSFTDVAPTVTANQGAVSAPENMAATNSGAWSDFGEAVTLAASAGTVSENANGSWSWTGTGNDRNPYTVTITATNGNGLAGTASFNVSFTNVPPTVTVNQASVNVTAGTTATDSGAWSDFGDAVTLGASVGTVTENSNGTWSWSFATANLAAQTKTVSITATNSDGNASSVSFTLTITSAAPPVVPVITALFTSSRGLLCGSHDGYVALAGAFTDQNVQTAHTVTVNWGDGTAAQVLANFDLFHQFFVFAGSHRYAHNGTFGITVTVTDANGAKASKTTTAVVAGLGVGHENDLNDWNGTLNAIGQYFASNHIKDTWPGC